MSEVVLTRFKLLRATPTRQMLVVGALFSLSACDDGPTAPGDPGFTGAILGSTIECRGGLAAGYACSNVDLVSFLPVEDVGGGSVPGAIPADTIPDITLNDLWG